ncbi:MAG: DODA-type extradiol aromatic ring-opening family dioxygenase [Microthrixaceae bacterium]
MSDAKVTDDAMLTERATLPTYYVSHGGGPWPWMMDQMPFDMSILQHSLQAMPAEVGVTPKAVLVVSAHWETREFTVQTHPNPPMLYDYGGFPEFTYHVQYPAPGDPEVAARVRELLSEAGIPSLEDPDRGFDHGMFAPMYVAWPHADVPMLQLSILRNFDPKAHFAAGRALAPLRDEGVLIVGSGLSYHNLRLFGPAAAEPSAQFDQWLSTTLMDTPAPQRTSALESWEQAPSARIAQPREDHLIPLMVALGAAEDQQAVRTYHETDMAGGITASSFRFG